MNQPPKPLRDRLPAPPPRPSSRSNLPKVGKEEIARKRLSTKLESIRAADVEAPSVDPRTVAVAGLMVANFVADEEVRKRFAPLVAAGLFDQDALDDLPVASRFVLRILPKLGPELDARTNAAPTELVSAARTQRERLMRLIERYLGDIDDANGRLVTVRMGDTPADTVYDLRMLAGLCRDYADTLASEAGTHYQASMEREARQTAGRLEEILLGRQSQEDQEWRAYLQRAVALLVPIYEEVCRAGRFLFHAEKPEARFPSLASVARVRRRLKRETAKRIESTPAMPAVKAPSSRPGAHYPPEASLVDVTEEDEKAIAHAFDDVPSLPAVEVVSVRPPPAPPTAPPSKPKAAPKLDPVEVVRLDFSSPSIAEDADIDPSTADLDLEVTYTSESNFYSDVTGADLGLFIATFVVKPPGTTFSVHVSIPQLPEPVMMRGAVRWVREFSPSIEAPPGMGIALQGLSASTRAAIDAFMKVRPPILHDE
jgi:hypothetical protein